MFVLGWYGYGTTSNTLVRLHLEYKPTTRRRIGSGTFTGKIRMETAKCIHFDILNEIRLYQDDPISSRTDWIKTEIPALLSWESLGKVTLGAKRTYIIRRVRLQIISDDCKTVLATLNPGAAFGELSILNRFGNKNENRRTTNVRALGYADLFSLSRMDLWDSLNDFPEAAVSMLEKDVQLFEEMGLILNVCFF